MRYLLIILLVLGLLSCETYEDPSVRELFNTNIISSDKWSAQEANFTTNFDVRTREVSTSLDHGPGSVPFEMTLNATVDGNVSIETNRNLDPTYISRYFIQEEDFLFERGFHDNTWEWRVLNTDARDSLDYTKGYVKIGNIRLKAKIYDHDQDRIYCYYDKANRSNGYTYKYHLDFWLIRQ